MTFFRIHNFQVVLKSDSLYFSLVDPEESNLEERSRQSQGNWFDVNKTFYVDIFYHFSSSLFISSTWHHINVTCPSGNGGNIRTNPFLHIPYFFFFGKRSRNFFFLVYFTFLLSLLLLLLLLQFSWHMENCSRFIL